MNKRRPTESANWIHFDIFATTYTKTSYEASRQSVWTPFIVIHLTLILTSAQVVETSVTITDNSPSQDYTHPDDQTSLLHL